MKNRIFKKNLRKQFLKRRQNMSIQAHRAASEKITALLNKVCQHNFTISAYVPIQNEVDICPFLKQYLFEGKTLALPRFHSEGYQLARITDWERDLGDGPFKTLEPISNCASFNPSHIEIWLVPGLVFDHQGYRIGYGKGVFDELLLTVSGQKIGVGYRWQKIEKICHESQDVRMDQLLLV